MQSLYFKRYFLLFILIAVSITSYSLITNAQTSTASGPPVMASPLASSVTQNSVTLSGNIVNTNGENASLRGFHYGTTASYGSAKYELGSYGSGSYSLNVNGLNCGTTYHFRAYAINSAGQGETSDAQFTTLSCTVSSGIHNLSGWAWSSNIGWISFNSANTGGADCASFCVTVENDGDMGGYAWSNNVGWLSFEPADIAGCPGATPANVDITTTLANGGNVVGFARFLAGKNRTDGWDGCLKLSGTNHSMVLNSLGMLTGYAWGSDVVGWVNFRTDGTRNVVCPGCGGGTPEDPLAGVCTSNPGGPVAPNTSVRFTASPTGGSGTYQYSWDGGAYSSINTLNKVFANSGTATLIVRDANNTANTLTMYCPAIEVTRNITLKLGTSPANATLNSLLITEGNPFVLKWDNPYAENYICERIGPTLVPPGPAVDTLWGWGNDWGLSSLGNKSYSTKDVNLGTYNSATYTFSIRCRNEDTNKVKYSNSVSTDGSGNDIENPTTLIIKKSSVREI